MTGAAILIATFVAYALLAAWLERAWISAPVVVVATGFVLGPSVLALLFPGGKDETLLRLTELTLAILLFADAATVPLRALREDVGFPGRLLGIGLAATIAFVRADPASIELVEVSEPRVRRQALA